MKRRCRVFMGSSGSYRRSVESSESPVEGNAEVAARAAEALRVGDVGRHPLDVGVAEVLVVGEVIDAGPQADVANGLPVAEGVVDHVAGGLQQVAVGLVQVILGRRTPGDETRAPAARGLGVVE